MWIAPYLPFSSHRGRHRWDQTPHSHGYLVVGFRLIRSGKTCGLRSGIGTTVYDAWTLAWALAGLRGAPLIFRDLSPFNYFALVATRLLYCGYIQSIEGPREQKSGHAVSVRESGRGCFRRFLSQKKELNAVPLALFEPKRCKGVFSFAIHTITSFRLHGEPVLPQCKCIQMSKRAR